MTLENLTPVTRMESILNGDNIEPVTREEYFWKQAATSGGGGGISGNVLPAVNLEDYIWTDAPTGTLYAKVEGQVVSLSNGTLVKGLDEAGLMFEQSVNNNGQTVFSALRYTAMNTEEFDGGHLHDGDFYIANVIFFIAWESPSSIYFNIPDDAVIIEKQ